MGKSIMKTSVIIVIMAFLLFAGNKGLADLELANKERYMQTLLPYLLPGSTTFTLEESSEDETDKKAAEEGKGTEESSSEEAGKEAASGAEDSDEEEKLIRTVYRGETGYVIHTVTQGYVEEIELLVGVDDAGKVKGLCVLGQHETFGLGAESQTNVGFLQQYLGTSGEAETGTTVDALTGATVSSKAVTKGVNAAVAYVTGADISSGATSWGG